MSYVVKITLAQGWISNVNIGGSHRDPMGKANTRKHFILSLALHFHAPCKVYRTYLQGMTKMSIDFYHHRKRMASLRSSPCDVNENVDIYKLALKK